MPQPKLLVFDGDLISDFALLKLTLKNLLESNPDVSKQAKYQALIGKLLSALRLAKSFMHDCTIN